MVLMTLALAEGGGDIISPDGSLVFVLVLFLVFVFLLNRILFRPVGRVLDERQTLIEGSANEALFARRVRKATSAQNTSALPPWKSGVI